MKIINMLFIGMTLLMFSCSDESEIQSIDYTGTYQGIITCDYVAQQGNPELNETQLTIEITKDSANADEFIIEFKDEYDPIQFKGRQVENSMELYNQTVNEGQGFDEVTMNGNITFLEAQDYNIVFNVSVDDEDEMDCNFIIIKQQ